MLCCTVVVVSLALLLHLTLETQREYTHRRFCELLQGRVKSVWWYNQHTIVIIIVSIICCTVGRVRCIWHRLDCFTEPDLKTSCNTLATSLGLIPSTQCRRFMLVGYSVHIAWSKATLRSYPYHLTSLINTMCLSKLHKDAYSISSASFSSCQFDIQSSLLG